MREKPRIAAINQYYIITWEFLSGFSHLSTFGFVSLRFNLKIGDRSKRWNRYVANDRRLRIMAFIRGHLAEHVASDM